MRPISPPSNIEIFIPEPAPLFDLPSPPPSPASILPLFSNEKLHFNELISHLPSRTKLYAKQLISQWEEDIETVLMPQSFTNGIRLALARLLFISDRMPSQLPDVPFWDFVDETFAAERASLFQTVHQIHMQLMESPLHSFEELYHVQLAQILGCALLTAQGVINFGLIEELEVLDSVGKLKQNLQLLSYDTQEIMHQVCAPHDRHSPSAQLIRTQLHLPPEAHLTDLHAKQVALGAVLADRDLQNDPEILKDHLRDYQSLLQFGVTQDNRTLQLKINDDTLDQSITISPDGKINAVPYTEIGSLANAMRQMGVAWECNPKTWVIDMTPRILIKQYAPNPQALEKGLYAYSDHKHRLIEARNSAIQG